MKTTTLALLSALTLGVATSASAGIVYQDNFDAADGIGTNTGIGGGMLSGSNITAADPFDDASGDAVAQTNFGNRVAFAWTSAEFDLSGGFTFDVSFTTAASTFGSNSVSFGIVDEVTAGTPAANGTAAQGNLSALFLSDAQDVNGVGFSFDESDDTGVVLDTGGTLSLLSDQSANFTEGTAQTLSLTVNADGSGSFALDANTPTAFAAGTFSGLFANSADDEFHVVFRSQGNPGLTVSDVTLTAVPEPGSLALLGLGGLMIARRRRGA